jgi:preprotein translocase subunit SecF
MYIVNIVLVAGIISFILAFFVLHKILNKIPMLSKYALMFQIVSAILLASGIYFKGGYTTEMMWRDRVKEVEAKVAEVEQQSQELNAKLEEERKKKQKVKVEYYNTVKTQIKEVEKVINGKCEIDPKVNELVNKAATNPEKAK